MERLRLASGQADVTGCDIAVLFVDLNRFKAVNDQFGHDIGDRLLVAIARRLRACVRPSDSMARLGGDEFPMLLEDVTRGRSTGRSTSRGAKSVQARV